jgi:hypothetical protein
MTRRRYDSLKLRDVVMAIEAGRWLVGKREAGSPRHEARRPG